MGAGGKEKDGMGSGGGGGVRTRLVWEQGYNQDGMGPEDRNLDGMGSRVVWDQVVKTRRA